jgi:signal transduction histidine kinase/HAMP domain-containing protein
MTLKSKMLILYVAVGTVILSVVGGWLTARFRQQQLEKLEKELANQLKLVDFSLTSFMAEVESDVVALATNELVRTENDSDFTNFVNADEETFVYDVGELEQSIIDVFNTFRITHPYVNSVYMGRENGSFVRSHKRELPSQYDPRTRPWYILAKENPGEVMRTAPYQSITTADVNIGVVTALVDDSGSTYGVVGADITLVNLAEYLSGFEFSHQGQILLTDAAGTVLVSEEASSQFGSVEALLGRDAEHLMSDDQGVLVFASGAESNYLFYYTSPVLGWKMAIEIPSSEIRAEIQSAVLPALSGLFLALALLSILTFIGLNTAVVRPLAHLNDAALEIIRTGDLRQEVEVEAGDEIGALATSFNQMVASVQQSHETLRRERDLAEALQDVTTALTGSLDFETVLDRILEQVSRIIPNEACNIMLIEDEQVKPVRWLGYERFGSEQYISNVVFSSSGTPSLKRMLSSKEPIVISNVAADPDWLHLPEMSWLRSYAAAPIVVRDQVIGFLSVDSSILDFFQQHQLEPLRAFANGAAIAIENARLYRQVQEYANGLEARVVAATEEIKQRADELAALYEVSRHLLATLDLDTLLPVVARRVAAVLGADRCAIFLFDEGAHVLLARAAYGYTAEQLVDLCYQPGEGIVGQAYTTGAPQYASNLDLMPDLPRHDEARTVLAVSLASPTAGLAGVLSVTSLRPEAFTPDQQRLLETMAGQAAIAIQNAHLYEAAQEADRLKSAFLASMSHELRTPLNSIIGFTGIILQGLVGPLNPEQEKQLNMVRDSSRHLLDLINDVLDISKIEAGQLETVSEPFDMRDAVGKVIRTMMPLAGKKGLGLVTEISPAVGQITSDRRRVEQILINLVNNAIKFTEQGEVSVECEIGGKWLITRVVDTGIGIKPEDVDKLFKAFQQIDTGVARKHEGTGLGLSICKKLVEMLGGEIWVESEWGIGSTFNFTLPVDREKDETQDSRH